jgi:hypothetical protein
MNNGRLPAWVLLLLYLAPQTRGLPTLPIDGTSTAIGFNHVCALTPTYDRSTGGVVVCSGNNDFGKALPPQELTFVQLAAGMYFTCGLHIDQTVHCWGSIAATLLAVYFCSSVQEITSLVAYSRTVSYCVGARVE